MGRGLATFLFRIYTSNKNVSRVKFMLINPCFHSFRQFENWVSDKDSFRRQLSMSLIGKFRNYGDVNVRPFSFVVENGDDDNENKGVVDFKKVNDFDGVHWNSDEDGIDGMKENDVNVCDSRVIESESDSDDRTVVNDKQVGFRNPVELYQELCNNENRMKWKR